MQRVNNYLSVGHYSDPQRKTGLTVFIPKKRSPCGYFLCGAAPALRETAVLDVSISNKIDALLFSGGSCFGLGATNGVMKWLLEQKRGVKIGKRIIPIVPTACIFDRGIYEQGSYPDQDNAYAACTSANSAIVTTGRVGVGTGATVGKYINDTNMHEGGFGYNFITGNNGLWVMTYSVVNAVGNVVDNSKVIAGAANDIGNFVNHIDKTLSIDKAIGANTTLVAIFTNAALGDKELQIICKMASAGMAQAIIPCFTPYDGDVIFTTTLGSLKVDIMNLGILAAESTRKSIINAVDKAKIYY
jgi:L-aminopeptidase/D-esterase-like protein